MMSKFKYLSKPVIAIIIIFISFIGCTVSYINTQQNDNNLGIGSTADINPGDIAPDIADPAGTDNEKPVIPAYERGEFRAVWVASVLNLDFPTKPGLSVSALRHEIDAIVTTTANMGLNTIILQVRPAGDAFYESDIFPWSEWLSGEQGTGIPDFDPLRYWIDVCRENNIELHAWLNPYRIIHPNANTSDIEFLSAGNPARQNPALTVAWASSDGRKSLYLDPGLPEARELIIDGIKELIEKYDVDGIHFDDYFYPGRDFNDDTSFETYGTGMERDDWRRENVNALIRDIQAVIRQHNNENEKNIRWGISPTAIWKNGSNDPLGIPTTAGQESYHALYADTRRWVMEEWVDYICPQIYWYIGYDIADFDAIYTWWSELCSGYNVDFYVGHAAYREFEDNQSPNWQGEIIRQLELMSLSDTSQGSAFYRYFSLRSGVGQSVSEFYKQTEHFPVRKPVFECDSLSIGFPAGDTSITGTVSGVSGHNIIGTSIPALPLYLNGQEVTARTEEGFFHVFPPLQAGDNVFTFSQDGVDDATVVITLKAPTGGGDTVTPPSVTEVTSLEYATVTADDAWVYSSNTTNSNMGYMLAKNSQDRIIAKSVSNNMLLLSCGVWVRSDSVSVREESAALSAAPVSGIYHIDPDFDIIKWSSDIFPAAVTAFDGKSLKVSFGIYTTVPELDLPEMLEDTLFERVNSGVNNGIPFYEFTIKDDVKFEGCYIEQSEDGFYLYLKKRKTLTDGEFPLSGIAIMLDAGHGGDANGTIGPMGYDLPEKELNMVHTLDIAARLEILGAEVILTRDTDTDVSLQERVNMSREVIPDLFISLHINSIAETTNAQHARGFSVWYYSANSAPFAETALDVLKFINPATNRQRVINQANFVVCRPWWSPHVLFEASFYSNIYDFAWLLDPAEQTRYTDAAVDAVLDYFAG